MNLPNLAIISRKRFHCLPKLVNCFSALPQIQFMHQNAPGGQQKDPYSLMKEDPIEVLSALWVRSFSFPIEKSFPNLTGFLSKYDLWILAYQRCCAHITSSFPPRNAIHLPVLNSLLALQSVVLSKKFRWFQWGCQYIHPPNEKPSTKLMSKRKLQSLLCSNEPPFQDHIVQEVLLAILEPIFEARFSSRSHSFRPGRNAHTAIRTIRSNFAGFLWFLKADLTSIIESINADVLIKCLERGVTDNKILSLIKSAIRSPVCFHSSEDDKKIKKKGKKNILRDDELKPDPYWLRAFFDFAPEEAAKVPSYGHCGILSPLLANVYLNELDQWLERRMVEFFCPSRLDSIWKSSISDGCHNPSWPEFVPASGKVKTRKMEYIRYGGHILVGVRGPREAAVAIRKELIEFCEQKYGIRLDNTNIEIEHISRGIQFLDHVISRRIIQPTLHYTATGGKIVNEKGLGTVLSVRACLQQCIKQFRRLKLVKGQDDPEPLPCTPMLYAGQAHTNSQMNKFLETMADWYRYADNRRKVVGFCAYVIRSSLAKLYAARYRLKSRAKVYRIASRDLSHPLKESNHSVPEYSDLLRMGLVDAIEGVQFSRMSMIPSCDYTPFPSNWVPDHERLLQEYVKLQDPKFFYNVFKEVKREGLHLPQDEIARTVWYYKVLGIRGRDFLSNMKGLSLVI